MATTKREKLYKQALQAHEALGKYLKSPEARADVEGRLYFATAMMERLLDVIQPIPPKKAKKKS